MDSQVRMGRVFGLVIQRLAIVLLASVVFVAVATAIRPGSADGAESTDDGPLTALERERAVELLSGATVRVSSGGCGRSSVGSGFVVEGLVVTNSHVVSGAERFNIDRPGSGSAGAIRAAAILVAADLPSVDLAFGTFELEPGLRFSTEQPAPNQPVLFAGYGGGQRLSIVATTVHSVVDGAAYGSEGSVMLLDTPSSVGFSGGPVVDRRGEVVAVLRAYDSVTGLTIAVPVAPLLDAHSSSYMERDVASCK